MVNLGFSGQRPGLKQSGRGQDKASFGTKTRRRNSHGQKQSTHGVNAIACSALGMVCWVLNLRDAEYDSIMTPVDSDLHSWIVCSRGKLSDVRAA